MYKASSIIVYVKHFDSSKTVSFKASDNRLLRVLKYAKKLAF